MRSERFLFIPAMLVNLVLFFTNGLGHGWTGILVGNVLLAVVWIGMMILSTIVLSLAVRSAVRKGAGERVEGLCRALGRFGFDEGLDSLLPSELGTCVQAEDFSTADRLWALIEPRFGRASLYASLAIANRAAHLVRLGRYHEALDILSRPEAGADTDAMRRRREFRDLQALLLNNRASACLSLGRSNDADEALRRAHDLDPKMPSVREILHLNRAWLAFHQGRVAEAVDVARSWLAAASAAHAAWALLLARSRAVEEASGVLSGTFDVGLAHTEFSLESARGFLAAQRDERDAARAHFDRAFSLSVPPGSSALEASTLFLAWGDAEAAGRYRRSLLERDGESIWARQAREGAGPGA